MYCEVCGIVDEHYDENALVHHNDTPKHVCNLILLNYKNNKKYFSKNRDGVIILCSAEYESQNATGIAVQNSDQHNIRIYVKPNEKVKFSFKITNVMKNEDLLVVGIQLAHPQPQFVMSSHPYVYGEDPNVLTKKSSIKEDISVKFEAVDIGQYEMPIMFTFYRQSDEKNIIFIREMVVLVQEEFVVKSSNKSPYTNEPWEKSENFFISTAHVPYQLKFKIPKLLKILLPLGLEETALEGLQVCGEILDQLRLLLISTRAIFDEGPTKNNYVMYFHHLLWWEEIISRINLRRYNMEGVKLEKNGAIFAMEVPGLAEKRPSLLRGDRVFIRTSLNVVFETIIKDINDCHIHLANMDESWRVKPNEKVKFSFKITNVMKNEDLLVVGIQLAHPQPQFVMSSHPYVYGEDPNVLTKKSSIKEDISVKFEAVDIGQYEMPIMFTFYRQSDEKNIIFIREMVVLVQEEFVVKSSNKSPYTNEPWEKSENFFISTAHVPYQLKFKIPKLLKILLPLGLEETALEGLQVCGEILDQLRLLLISTRAIFDEGPTKNNYVMYFHHLLWWEEIISRINLRRYNMEGVKLEKNGAIFAMEVPGLAEKRPSLLRGDRVFIRTSLNVVFETIIKDINDCHIHLANMDESFLSQYSEEAVYEVRFLMSRVPRERLHEAVNSLFSSKQLCRVFPERAAHPPPRASLSRFYNPLIPANAEQKAAVEHIVAGTSGKAPYIVFGPPGTGKTMTIVEAIIQLVVCNPKNRIMVCTDSNMAADHIALMLLKYNKQLNVSNFLFRANSQSREWSVMPPELAPVSNGTKYGNFYSVSNEQAATYRIFITTLVHAARYGSARSQAKCKLQMTHLFIDEAAQAAEPAALVPVTTLLAPSGRLVLAGDPQQLGPVCISQEASQRGLGTSLLERLKLTYENLYTDPNYITMLVKNFRSNPDILAIPNELFYDNRLEPLAPYDALSGASVLGLAGAERAVVFHAVHSHEQRMDNAPSFFNEKELEMLKIYVKALIEKHEVSPKDIGIIAPYIRQVYKMKGWLKSENYTDIEVGTVEAFQGKEKRVILVSTVRANCRLLDCDAKYGLGFLVDDKRFNVAITRAKAKLIIIGNPACLTRDVKWRKYMEFCEENKCYYGHETQQMERNSLLLTEIARTSFDKCSLSDFIKPKTNNDNKNKSGKKKKRSKHSIFPPK